MKTHLVLSAIGMSLVMSSASVGALDIKKIEAMEAAEAKIERKLAPLAAKIETQNEKLVSDMKRFNVTSGDIAKSLGNTAADLVFTPISPCRAVETRDIGGTFASSATGTQRNYDMRGTAASVDFTDQVTGTNGATPCTNTAPITPSVNAKAVLVAISVIAPSTVGYLNAWAFSETEPIVATMVFTGGGLSSSFAVVPLCQAVSCSDDISFKVYGASTHVAVDIYGYFVAPEATALDCATVSFPTAAAATGLVTGTAACAVGYTVTGGTCDTSNSGAKPITSSRISGNGWACETNNYPGNTTAATLSGGARCCRVPGR
jgi:hypothetical protein